MTYRQQEELHEVLHYLDTHPVEDTNWTEFKEAFNHIDGKLNSQEVDHK